MRFAAWLRDERTSGSRSWCRSAPLFWDPLPRREPERLSAPVARMAVRARSDRARSYGEHAARRDAQSDCDDGGRRGRARRREQRRARQRADGCRERPRPRSRTAPAIRPPRRHSHERGRPSHQVLCSEFSRPQTPIVTRDGADHQHRPLRHPSVAEPSQGRRQRPRRRPVRRPGGPRRRRGQHLPSRTPVSTTYRRETKMEREDECDRHGRGARQVGRVAETPAQRQLRADGTDASDRCAQNGASTMRRSSPARTSMAAWQCAALRLVTDEVSELPLEVHAGIPAQHLADSAPPDVVAANAGDVAGNAGFQEAHLRLFGLGDARGHVHHDRSMELVAAAELPAMALDQLGAARPGAPRRPRWTPRATAAHAGSSVRVPCAAV